MYICNRHSSTGIWNLSEQCITGQGTLNGLSEYLESHPSLALEMATHTAYTPAKSEFTALTDDSPIDGIDHDDDLTLNPDQLTQALEGNHHTLAMALSQNEKVQVVDSGVLMLQKGIDNDLTYADAEGDSESDNDL
ncbi:hypothetical protein P691DRAFT_765784 [Macrolepiota fuliginosa MF-IS2]|uniref:Uncharacterized protein n=1 Tax=Macrolepiota fuliginosa MF-IS2 TaxID=1400762 RepID=A0A9P6BVK0_9AGAR|nr:hypothetical protein P691DRAFT_765784 [Macrolepiota fuliginosa MF-IS2]